MWQSDQSHGLHPWAEQIHHATTPVTHKCSQVTSHFEPTPTLQAFLSAHPVDTGEMGIKVLHLAEGVVCLHTARDPTEEGPLPGRITGAHVAVFPHGLPRC